MAVEEAHLNAIDAALGDGDHGITMRQGFEAIKTRLDDLDNSAGIREVLIDSGDVFMGATGGAIGIILGKMLIAAGNSLGDAEELGTSELAIMLASMESSIMKVGKAKPGDKTILDAVHAASEAAKAAPPNKMLIWPDALEQIATAASEAAQRTADMVCRVGRASRFGERTLGHPDPGAVSFSIILRCFVNQAKGIPEVGLGNRHLRGSSDSALSVV